MTRTVESDAEAVGPADDAARIRVVPADADVRRRLRDEAAHAARRLDPSRPARRSDLEALAREVLTRVGLTDAHLGFTMVAIDNTFWHDVFAAVPFHRRLLLLPHCLRDRDACRGHYSASGLHCQACGSCVIGDLKARAETLGYQVLVAEGTPAVLQVVLDGQADAILGVACMESLEKAFARVSDLGIPHLSVPLLTDGCVNTTAEVDLIAELIEQYRARSGPRVSSRVPLLRAASGLCDDDSLRALLGDLVRPEAWDRATSPEPIVAAEHIALEWLCQGGKRFRPFITLAAYAASTHGGQVLDVSDDVATRLPRSVRSVALAIEALHKASLVHDDIEDDDAFRYGHETLHRRYGVAQAINVGDYLIGLGYRLVAAQKHAIGADAVADILTWLTDAHQKLCQGQGAELALCAQVPRRPTPQDVMTIYALKTSPAFQVAIVAGLRLATPNTIEHATIRSFCRVLGVGYQTRNDLKDWQGDRHDKLLVGQDALAMRPTVLEAFACEAGLPGPAGPIRQAPDQWLTRTRDAYQSAGVFARARQLVDGCRDRALKIAAEAQPADLGQLMDFVVRTVLS